MHLMVGGFIAHAPHLHDRAPTECEAAVLGRLKLPAPCSTCVRGVERRAVTRAEAVGAAEVVQPLLDVLFDVAHCVLKRGGYALDAGCPIFRVLGVLAALPRCPVIKMLDVLTAVPRCPVIKMSNVLAAVLRSPVFRMRGVFGAVPRSPVFMLVVIRTLVVVVFFGRCVLLLMPMFVFRVVLHSAVLGLVQFVRLLTRSMARVDTAHVWREAAYITQAQASLYTRLPSVSYLPSIVPCERLAKGTISSRLT